MKRITYICSLLLICCFISSCTKDHEPSEEQKKEQETKKVKSFVYSYMKELYLWNENGIKKPLTSSEQDPYEYFEGNVDRTVDLWSSLTNKAEDMTNAVNSINTTYGMKLGISISSNDTLISVLYVFKDSPAYYANIKRGDIILTIDGVKAIHNVLPYILSQNITITRGKLTADNTIEPYEESIILHPIEMYCEPIIAHRIIEQGGKKIGYLFYTSFIDNSVDELITLFTNWKAQGVDEMIFDLRHNGGGSSPVFIKLANILAPQKHLTNKDPLVKLIYNDYLTGYYEKKGQSNIVSFDPKTEVNMDFKRIVFLVNNNSASASEALIVALQPYMDVTLIGEKTAGKYCGGNLFQPVINEKNDLDPDIKNWLLYLMTFKIANANDYTDYKEGLAIDIPIDENYLINADYGSIEDPSVKEALNVLIGNTTSITERAIPSEYRALKTIDRKKSLKTIPFINPLHTDPIPFVLEE